MAEEPLAGGNMSGVVRVGATVHRAAGPWSPTIHRLLRHLGAGVPQPIGFDGQGREVLTFLAGTVPQDPMPAWVWEDRVLLAAGRRLAALHAATVHFGTVDAVWRSPVREPREVVCHNDFAPYNLVFDERHELVGVIDWDMASPGPRVWDLAYLAYRLVPLSAPSNPDLLRSGSAERRRRLELLCAAYGHGVTPAAVARTAVDRLHDLADLTAARLAAGAHHLAGHADLYRTDATHLTAQRTALS